MSGNSIIIMLSPRKSDNHECWITVYSHCGHYHRTIYIIKYSTYTGVGGTDGYRYDVIFIMVDIFEVAYGAHNDKSPEAVV